MILRESCCSKTPAFKKNIYFILFFLITELSSLLVCGKGSMEGRRGKANGKGKKGKEKGKIMKI